MHYPFSCQTYAESPWNLNNLPNLESSVLRHVMTDISGMKVCKPMCCPKGPCFKSLFLAVCFFLVSVKGPCFKSLFLAVCFFPASVPHGNILMSTLACLCCCALPAVLLLDLGMHKSCLTLL